MAYLEEHGYAVIAGVASAESIVQAHSDFWKVFDLRPEQVCTDSSKGAKWIANPSNGIISSMDFNHSDFLWNARTLPGVRRAFASIWQTQDLITSFDGGNAFRPWKRNPEWLTSVRARICSWHNIMIFLC